MNCQEEYNKALNKLAAYCASAEKCTEDVSRKMAHMDLTEEEQDRILSFLKENRYLDEERFAKAFVNDKYRFAKWGKKKIVQNLLLRGVDESAIMLALDYVDLDVYRENLESLLIAKRKSVKYQNEYDLKGKLIRYAIGRGYDYSDILKVMPELELF